MVARQLLKPRIGSIAEDEVAALLRRIAFFHRPLVPDDIGADFVCAVAKKQLAGKNPKKPIPMLYAGSWFLLSVKSGNAKVGLERSSGHFDWFTRLEIPFLIAQVEDDKDLRLTLYHTLQHIAVINELPPEVKRIEFLCKPSPLYKPNNYRLDRQDVIDVRGDSAIAWLGPPLLSVTRPQLLDSGFCEKTSSLLQAVCDFHPSIRRRAIVGMPTGVMWETNDSIRAPVKGYVIDALVKSTYEGVMEIESVFGMNVKRGGMVAKLYHASQPLFRFYRAMKRLEETDEKEITEDEVFGGVTR